MEVEDVAVEVLHGELAQSPGLCFKRLDDVCARGLEFLVGGIDVVGEDPLNGGFERGLAFAEKDGDRRARDGADFFAGVEPSDLEAEYVAVVLLRAFDIGNGEFGDGLTERGYLLFCFHENLRCEPMAHAMGIPVRVAPTIVT